MPSCGRMNSSKGSTAHKDFLRRSRDGRGLDYKILRWCEYVGIYKTVKAKYQLSFANNDKKYYPTALIGCHSNRFGGWALKSVGQGYGDGYEMELLVKYLTKITGR